jgi:hypothetical protein
MAHIKTESTEFFCLQGEKNLLKESSHFQEDLFQFMKRNNKTQEEQFLGRWRKQLGSLVQSPTLLV